MRNVFFIVLVLCIGGVWYAYTHQSQSSPVSTLRSSQTDLTTVTVIAENLDTPWAIAFLPDNSMLITERPGRVRFIDSAGYLDPVPVATVAQAREVGEGGLLGITVHPDFVKNHYVYLYYTYEGSNGNTLNRVVRMVYENKKLSGEEVIIDAIPGSSNHNGGRLKFGPDNALYVTTGDAENPSQAQDMNSKAGKILKDGNIYSYGHRNPQGLAWDSAGKLWATEHGRSGIQSGFDEINLITSGKNYGWPTIQGDQVREGMVTSVFNSGATTTWAPAGVVFVGSSLFFGGLRGQTLYEAVIENDHVVKLKEHLKGEYGRLRDVVLGPDKMLYVTTSNQDGRGIPSATDDRVLRIHPAKL